MKPSIEQLSLQKYTQQHPQVRIIPYDTTIPQRSAYMRNLSLMDDQLHQQLNAVKMNQADSLLWTQYRQFADRYYTFIFNNKLSVINQDSIVGLTRTLYAMKASHTAPLVARYITDSALRAWFEHELHFWVQRNEYMAAKIIETLDAYPNKKIVVLTGLNHKYILTDLLRKKYGKDIQLLSVQ